MLTNTQTQNKYTNSNAIKQVDLLYLAIHGTKDDSWSKPKFSTTAAYCSKVTVQVFVLFSPFSDKYHQLITMYPSVLFFITMYNLH